jgi:hypothetical protein
LLGVCGTARRDAVRALVNTARKTIDDPRDER